MSGQHHDNTVADALLVELNRARRELMQALSRAELSEAKRADEALAYAHELRDRRETARASAAVSLLMGFMLGIAVTIALVGGGVIECDAHEECATTVAEGEREQ